MRYNLIILHSKNDRHKRLLKRSQFLFLEKRVTLRFIAGAKLHYGPKITPEVSPYIIAERERVSLVNIYFLIAQLKKTLQLIYVNSYGYGMTTVSALNESKNIYNGINLEKFVNNGCYYFFTKWYNGFLTNFPELIIRALTYKAFDKTQSSHGSISLDILETKRIPQLPTMSVALNLQHWHCNEAHAIVIPQAIGIHTDFSVNQYSPNCIIPFNGTIIPALVIMLLIKDTILSATLDDKIYFLRDKNYINFAFKKFTFFPKYEKHFVRQKKKSLKKIMVRRAKFINKKNIYNKTYKSVQKNLNHNFFKPIEENLLLKLLYLIGNKTFSRNKSNYKSIQRKKNIFLFYCIFILFFFVLTGLNSSVFLFRWDWENRCYSRIRWANRPKVNFYISKRGMQSIVSAAFKASPQRQGAYEQSVIRFMRNVLNDTSVNTIANIRDKHGPWSKELNEYMISKNIDNIFLSGTEIKTQLDILRTLWPHVMFPKSVVLNLLVEKKLISGSNIQIEKINNKVSFTFITDLLLLSNSNSDPNVIERRLWDEKSILPWEYCLHTRQQHCDADFGYYIGSPALVYQGVDIKLGNYKFDNRSTLTPLMVNQKFNLFNNGILNEPIPMQVFVDHQLETINEFLALNQRGCKNFEITNFCNQLKIVFHSNEITIENKLKFCEQTWSNIFVEIKNKNLSLFINPSFFWIKSDDISMNHLPQMLHQFPNSLQNFRSRSWLFSTLLKENDTPLIKNARVLDGTQWQIKALTEITLGWETFNQKL